MGKTEKKQLLKLVEFEEMLRADLNDAIEKQEQEQDEDFNRGREEALKYCLHLLRSVEPS